MSKHLFYLPIFFFAAFGLSPHVLAAEIQTVIEKRSPAEWMVTYSVQAPVSKLTFKISPDNSRAARWKSLSNNFTIKYEDGSEYIERQDGNAFTEVSFQLTPNYVVLPKEYAPFSPFSDGGMLVYSGRFFACIDICDSNHNQWEISVVAPSEDNIIVNGNIYKKTAAWVDSNSGTKIYIGHATPLEEKYFISVIDKNLPKGIKNAMSVELPQLMQFFAGKFGPLNFRPALFASFSNSHDGGFGHQGGTLPGQVFMHWYGKKAIEQLDSESTYWFFAHEVAHIYQQEAGDVKKAEDAWVHEGTADLFAGLASKADFFENQLAQANTRCIAALQASSSYNEASSSDFNVHYTCGLVIMSVINSELTNQNQGHDIFTLWNLFSQQVAAGKTASARTFIDTATPYLSSELLAVLESIATQVDYNPINFFRQLEMEKTGFISKETKSNI